ncbi:MAG: hypothetical protein LBQ30_09975 [Treponema sp.]|jgi:hypothetical protein|nr:hypothetical protein [Treponema sp.]
MPRPRKPTEQLKLSGTYREDRHGKNADTQIAGILDIPVELLPPQSITDPYCIEHYKYHTNLLIRLNILTASDLPELELLYLTLQQCREIRAKLADIDMIGNPQDYTRLTRLAVILSDYVSKISQKYYISPVSRMKLQIDQLNLREKQQGETLTGKLIKKKKA